MSEIIVSHNFQVRVLNQSLLEIRKKQWDFGGKGKKKVVKKEKQKVGANIGCNSKSRTLGQRKKCCFLRSVDIRKLQKIQKVVICRKKIHFKCCLLSVLPKFFFENQPGI